MAKLSAGAVQTAKLAATLANNQTAYLDANGELVGSSVVTDIDGFAYNGSALGTLLLGGSSGDSRPVRVSPVAGTAYTARDPINLL